MEDYFAWKIEIYTKWGSTWINFPRKARFNANLCV